MARTRPKYKVIKAWADVGNHGGIFSFISGPVKSKYPGLMHIYAYQVTPDLVPVEIRFQWPRKGA